ncbi:hypothetical protein [Nocardia sp. NPDC004711]
MLDFVGHQPTVDIAMAGGDGKSTARVGFGISPYEAAVTAPSWGSCCEPIELIGLAQEGVFEIATERFGLDVGPEAYRGPTAGTLRGRAVIVPWIPLPARATGRR